MGGFPLVFGLDTFGDLTNDADGRPLSHAETIRDVVEQGVLAEQVGVDFFGIGEHHTDDFPMPAGDVVLAAIAARTERIHLGSAVTVLSSTIRCGCSSATRRSTPSRAVGPRSSSGGARASTRSRSSATTSPTTRQLFEEKTELFARWSRAAPSPGRARPGPRCSTRTSSPTSRPVRSRRGSASAAAPNRSPRRPARLRAHARHHRRTPARFAPSPSSSTGRWTRYGQPARPVGVHSPGHVAATDEQAREEFWPHYLEVIRHVSKTRGFAVPTKESFLHETDPDGALYVGSPETVARKIAANLPALGATASTSSTAWAASPTRPS